MQQEYLLMKKVLIIICTCFICCCNKDKDPFPDIYVNKYLYPNNAEFNGLNSPGNSAYILGGVNGIIIFHDYFDEYIAYDRACRNDPHNSCEQVYLDENEINTLSCYCCDSKYFIFDGSVIQGPTQRALYRYQTSFNGVELRIYN